MSITRYIPTIVEKFDLLKSVYEKGEKILDPDASGLDRATAAAEFVAGLAAGVAAGVSVRVTCSAIRLGLAISGKIWEWETIAAAAGTYAGMGTDTIINGLRDWVTENQILDPFFNLINPQVRDNKAISPTIGTTPDPLVKTIRYIDPLILDLDGDGLDITPLNLVHPVLFDADGDTVRTATAWAGTDDGLLALDRNGNGSIDDGGELFGDETLRADGTKAPDGFAALRELDSNGDGLFSAADSQFGDVRVWRDLNQDGLSQASELQSLAEAGVQSVTLASTATNVNYRDARLIQDGIYTRSDGSTGQAGSFILAQSSFVRQFVPIAVSADAAELPNLGGSGWVRDLHARNLLEAANDICYRWCA